MTSRIPASRSARARQALSRARGARPTRYLGNVLRRVAVLFGIATCFWYVRTLGEAWSRDGVTPELVVQASLGLLLLLLFRRPLGRWIHRLAVKHRFRKAMLHAGLETDRHRIPVAHRVTAVPAGDHVLAVVPSGSEVARLERSAEQIAVTMGAREVRVARRVDDARVADVLVVRRDPLVELATMPWPWRDLATQTLWQPVPIGVDEAGNVVEIGLPEHNLLLGGEPGGGKSVALSQLVAAAALDPRSNLWLLDGKVVELAAWRSAADGSVGVSVDEAIDVLRDVQRRMDERYVQLLDEGLRKINPMEHALHVVACDELAHYLTAGDRNQTKAFTEVLRDLVSRGRAAGVIVLAATQKPSSDVVPTSIRDLFGYRWAFRCSSSQASDTILGQGWASQGFSAATIDPGLRGVGWLLHEGGVPIRMRSFWLDDDTIRDIGARATAVREQERWHKHELLQ